MPSANRQYKDSLFTHYFTEDTSRLVEAYNAITGACFPLDADVGIETLERVLYGEWLNDIAFTIGSRHIVLVEHQSTFSANLPLRMLMYVARTYERLVPRDAAFKRAALSVPTPEFIVLYNGPQRRLEHERLALSGLFSAPADEPSLELLVDVYDIGGGANAGMLSRSRALSDYAAFVNEAERLRSEGAELAEAVGRAAAWCAENGIMAEYLERHGSEVRNMLITEWNLEDALRVAREESREEGLEQGLEQGIVQGREEGREEGLEQGIVQGRSSATLRDARGFKARGVDPVLIAEVTGLPLAEVQAL